MGLNMKWGDPRLISIGLAIAAVIGWALFIYAQVSASAQNRRAHQVISELTYARDGLQAQLTLYQQAVGSLTDLQAKTQSATDQTRQATAARDRATAELAAVRKDLELRRDEQAQIVEQLQAAKE